MKRIKDLTSRSRMLLGMLAVAAITSGCNHQPFPTYPVTGTVEFADGTPVAFGHIELYHEQHDLTARGTIQPDGSFSLGTFDEGDGAVEGTHRAIVVQLLIPGQMNGAHPDHGRHVARNYADYSTSGLEVVVSSDKPNHPRLVLAP